MTRPALTFLVLLLLAAFPVLAQDAAPESVEEERSLFISFIENQLSTPNRQIRINGINGVLSSQASIDEITVADREGIWLRISGASIDWSRSTLLLRQRLEIARLAAESIEVSRRPLPEEGLPSPEARSFAVPQFPIAINLAELEVPSVSFGAGVFGLESELFVEGRLRLEEGSLDTALQIERLDGPGGNLSLEAVFDNEAETLDLDLALSEPQNGVLANMLNIEGRPPLSLTLEGSGPIEQLDLALALSAAGEPALSGNARFREQPEGLRFTIDVGGPIARLIPSQFRDFFGAQTSLAVSGVARSGGGLFLEEFNLASAALDLQATAETASDGFLTRLSVDADIADPAGRQVLLPVRGGETSLASAQLAIRFGDAGGEEWTASLDVTDLRTGAFAAGIANLEARGTANGLGIPGERSITFRADGAISHITAERAEIAEALGSAISLAAEGEWQSGEPVTVRTAELRGNNLLASFAGTIMDYALRGDYRLLASDIAAFSGLADRELGGTAGLDAHGEIRPISGAFDLVLDGTAEGLRLDVGLLDPLLSNKSTITGRLARTVEGFLAEGFRIASDAFELGADGTISSQAANFRFDLALEDVATLTNRAAGRLNVSGEVAGGEDALGLRFLAEMARGRLLDRVLTDANLVFDGMVQGSAVTGLLSGDAFLDGVRASLRTGISTRPEGQRLEDLSFTAGGASLTGDLMRDVEGLFSGTLSLEAADISTAAALLLVEARGALDASILLEPREDKQHASVKASARNLTAEGFSIERGELEAEIADLLGVPAVEGRLRATNLVAAGIDVATLSATADTVGGATTFFAGQARLANGAEIDTRGMLAPQQDGFRVTLDAAELRHADIAARLRSPTSLEVYGGRVALGTVDLDLAGGRLLAEGEIGNTLDLTASLERVPLSIANSVRPQLALGGVLDGQVTVGGTTDRPVISFDLDGSGITAAELRNAGLSSVDFDASGETRGDNLRVLSQLTSPGGLRAQVEGDVPLGDGALAVDVRLQAFPLSLLNTRIPNQDLGGSLTGSARVTGSLEDPQAVFSLQASGVTALPLASVGATPMQISAEGSYTEQRISLSSFDASGPAGLDISGSGQVPLSGPGLAVDLRGSAPLSLASRLFSERGTQLAGTVTASVGIRGSLANPAFSGNLSIAEGTAVDPLTNLRLSSIRVDAGLSGDTVTIRSASAALAAGGSLTLSGNISTNAAAGFPAELTARLEEARYTDGELVSATVNGDLRLNGPLTRDPLLSGSVSVSRAEILIPDQFGGWAAQIDVQHIAPPPAVVQTLERARALDGTPMPSERPSVLRLDVNIDAPARIFVRGRGLDAELGGSVRLTGPVTSIQPVGGFRLIRGRLSILAQRVTLEEGVVTLVGDLDPFLDFTASSSGRDITVFVTVRGQVSDLAIDFSSQPELPEDEVLARLIFDRGIDELSPLQLAQLAAAAADLAGGAGSASLLGSIRSAATLDDLDIVTDAEDNAGVRAGRYIQENVYLGVEAGARGRTRATINLDITDNLTARGGLGTNGDSDIGIFFERDY
ncbi:translocation/assembly module TamB domain-containing protein [Chelativorans sp. Marseille-P2723]|uniref:translocation/assembly module TamB domain-containing protein n=1 Tax=Chelativorans sp. Marseille-P2723 TaxID=2709133 RepID=UPI001570B7D4|nr:translocation/assembly module TamB domain-containing protein [Chelativorans sp. Marseille-P2723]